MRRCHMDVHWQPYIARCAFCSINYTVVAKLETFQDDLMFIGRLAGVTFKEIVSHDSSGGRTEKLSKKYFGQMDRQTVWQLYQLYKMDFELFGYSPGLYLDMARS